MEKICGIYKITSPSKKIYIGQSSDVYSRWKKYNSLSCITQPKLFNSLKKYGYNKHKLEIICQCDELELNSLEKYYVDLFQTFNSEYGMNLRDGGGAHGKWSKETKIKMSLAAMGKNTWTKGRRRPESERIRISETHTGIKNPFYGKKHTKETLIKFSNRRASNETKQKMSNIRKNKLGENNPVSKIILNTQTGIFYYGIKAAADSIGMKVPTLTGRMSGRRFNSSSFIYA